MSDSGARPMVTVPAGGATRTDDRDALGHGRRTLDPSTIASDGVTHSGSRAPSRLPLTNVPYGEPEVLERVAVRVLRQHAVAGGNAGAGENHIANWCAAADPDA